MRFDFFELQKDFTKNFLHNKIFNVYSFIKLELRGGGAPCTEYTVLML